MGNCLCKAETEREDSVTDSLADEDRQDTIAPTPDGHQQSSVKSTAHKPDSAGSSDTLKADGKGSVVGGGTGGTRSSVNKGKFHFVPDENVVRDVYSLFHIEKELGRGASCRVMRVRRKTDNYVMAMKEMRKDDKWNPMLFEQEVDILQRLAGHPNILHYEACYMDNKNFYICTSLCTGGELFDKIKELRHFNESHASETMKTILDAMKYCHQRNVVHRDLKPENIVYKTTEHEHIVIIDFGDAKEVEEHSKHDDFVGTAFYLAPESIRTREGWELKKSDMWTIGVIAYVLVTGRPPFWGRENKEIIRKILRGQVRFPSTIKLSENCKDFILQLLIKDPKQRMSAADALNHPWITGGDHEVELDAEILKNLATFGTANKLKQLIVKTVAANLDKKHRREYERQFTALDLKKDGKIDHEEFSAFLMRCELPPDKAQAFAQELVRHISGDTNKPITKEDWNHSNVAKLLSSSHLIQRQYKKLDVDEDGLISVTDLMSIFEGASRAEIEEIIDEIDIDCDGQINFEEFQRAMRFDAAYPGPPPPQ